MRRQEWFLFWRTGGRGDGHKNRHSPVRSNKIGVVTGTCVGCGTARIRPGEGEQDRRARKTGTWGTGKEEAVAHQTQASHTKRNKPRHRTQHRAGSTAERGGLGGDGKRWALQTERHRTPNRARSAAKRGGLRGDCEKEWHTPEYSDKRAALTDHWQAMPEVRAQLGLEIVGGVRLCPCEVYAVHASTVKASPLTVGGIGQDGGKQQESRECWGHEGKEWRQSRTGNHAGSNTAVRQQ